MFSSKWDPGTGDLIVTCADDPKVCPTSNDLAHIRRIEIWAEGVKGNIHLEIQSIWAGTKDKTFSESIEGNIFSSSGEEISLITFDGEPSTTFKFKQYNDPVMVRIHFCNDPNKTISNSYIDIYDTSLRNIISFFS